MVSDESDVLGDGERMGGAGPIGACGLGGIAGRRNLGYNGRNHGFLYNTSQCVLRYFLRSSFSSWTVPCVGRLNSTASLSRSILRNKLSVVVYGCCWSAGFMERVKE